MRKEKLLLKEELNRINELNGNNLVSGKHLVVVDIQPEYASGFKSFMGEFVNFINQNYESMAALTFMYNGSNTVGEMNEGEYQYWLLECGIDEDVINGSRFYDKGYAFFRYCIDSNIEEDSTTNLVRFMISKNINDSRDLTNEFWDEFINIYGNTDVRELIEFADDCISIPDLMDEIKDYRGIIVCGGGINECLKEVEIALNALDKPYSVLTQFVY